MYIDKDKRTLSLALYVAFITFVVSMTIANVLWIFIHGPGEALEFPFVIGIIGGIAFKAGAQLRQIIIGAVILSIADVIFACVSALS